MKVGILTFHKAVNYGAVLQAYALQETLKKEYEVTIIDYITSADKNRYYASKIDNRKLVGICRSVVTVLIQKTINSKFAGFRKKYLNLGKYIETKDELAEYCNNIDAVVVGSDQVWNLEITEGDMAYFLNFDTKSKKISYAASIGTDGFVETYRNQISECIREFSAVSVRESTALTEVSKYSNNVSRVIDPTLMINKSDWIKIAEKPKSIPERFVMVYGFGVDKAMIEEAKRIAKDKNARVVLVGNYIRKMDKEIYVKRSLSPQEWIYMIANAECVVTNSFHGTAFAIDFEKNVRIFRSKTNLTDTNSRIEDLTKMFEIYDEYIDGKIIDTNNEGIKRILKEQRLVSTEYLKSSLA